MTDRTCEVLMMSRVVTTALLCLLIAAPAAAQNHPTRLATLFEDIYGPNGLVLSSDMCSSTARTTRPTSAAPSVGVPARQHRADQPARRVPLPSPARASPIPLTRAAARSSDPPRAGPILAERGETSARPPGGQLRVSIVHVRSPDGVPLVAVPAVFRHDNPQLGGGGRTSSRR